MEAFTRGLLPVALVEWQIPFAMRIWELPEEGVGRQRVQLLAQNMWILCKQQNGALHDGQH